MRYQDESNQRGVVMLLALIIMLAVSFLSPESKAGNTWQDTQAYPLSDYQLEREKRELVTIYSGFTDTRVEQILIEQFDHVQYMMFVNTVITSPATEPKRDVSTGEVQTEDDGC